MSTPVLHLVRHGRPVLESHVPADQWRLADGAAAEVERLGAAGVLPQSARWFSSPEPKATATAGLLTSGAVSVVDGLREMTRPASRWLQGEEWRTTVRRAFSDPDTPAHPGWESANATADRVTTTVRAIWDSGGPTPVVLVGHGTAWTLLLARLTDTPPDVDAWGQLRMLDHCVLRRDDTASVVVASPWGAWDGFQPRKK